MTQDSKLDWTEYKSRFRAVTAYGTYWVDKHAGSTSYQLICGTNPCCVMFSSPQEAKDYAQTIHDRPTSRDDWFNLSDVEQAPYHASLELPELLRTYETLLAGDNLPARIAVQTVDLRALLEAAKTMDVAAVREQCAQFAEGFRDKHWIAHDIKTGIFPNKSEVGVAIAAGLRALSAEPAPTDRWHNISLLGERELGRLIVIGAFDGKGRWCATVRRAQRFIDHHNENAGSLKKAMRLKWEPTHFMELTGPRGAFSSGSVVENNQQPNCCTHCNGTHEVQRPDSEFLLPCPECFPTAEAGK